MHRFSFLALCVAAATVAPIVPACSSNGGTSNGNPADAGSIGPNQLVGQPCDPTLSSPCLQGNPCDSFTCDITQTPPICAEQPLGGPCGSLLTDGGPEFFDDSGATSEDVSIATCTSDNQCPTLHTDSDDREITITFVCAFPIADLCEATGVCVIPPASPPTLGDGAPLLSCGCDGQPVGYVDTNTTTAPISTVAPCPTDSGAKVDSGNDSGSGDASLDAPSDSSDN